MRGIPFRIVSAVARSYTSLRAPQCAASQLLQPSFSWVGLGKGRCPWQQHHGRLDLTGAFTQIFSPYTTEDLRVLHSELQENQFHKLADDLLEQLQEKLEAYVEDQTVQDSDVEYSAGVLTVKLGQQGTYVINKQTPNRQIWLSSPVSGPFRFDYSHGRWVYHRTGQDLLHHLEAELTQLIGEPPQLED